MTAEELAVLCGVSRRAVHRALTGAPDISPKTRNKILETARKYKYVPSSAGQVLRSGRTGLLGFVAGNLHDPYYSHLAMHVIDEALLHGYQVVFSSTEWDARKETEAFRNIMAQKVDGMIYMPDISREQQSILPLLLDRKFPLVLSRPNNYGFPAVHADYRGGFVELVAALSGYGRLGLLMHSSDQRIKAEIFREVCTENNVYADIHITGEWHPEDENSGEYFRIIGENPQTEIWIVSGGSSAIRTHLLLRGHNKPGQIVVLNGVSAFSYQNPPLWALTEDIALKAKYLVSLALGEKTFPAREYLVPMKFIR